MQENNPNNKKKAILNAAYDEFSEFGLFGARVDSIAARANCNKNLIYINFKNKDNLFRVILKSKLAEVYENTSHFDPNNIEEYVDNMFEFSVNNSKTMRLLAWNYLESNSPSFLERKKIQSEKISAIKRAQNTALISDAFPADFLFYLISSIATSFSSTNPFGGYGMLTSAEDKDTVKQFLVKILKNILSSKL